MQSTLLISMPMIYHGTAVVDLKTEAQTDLGDNHAITLVTYSMRHCEFLVDHFFTGHKIKPYLNIDTSNPKLPGGIFLDVLLTKPVTLSDDDIIMVVELSQDCMVPPTRTIERVIYGNTFSQNDNASRMLKDTFDRTGHFHLAIGAWSNRTQRVLVHENAEAFRGDTLYTLPQDEFEKMVRELPEKPW